jgi:hypothetical protein
MKPFWSFLILFYLPISVTFSQEENSDFNQEDQQEYSEEEEFEPVKLNFYEASFSSIIPSGRFAEKVDQSVFWGFNLAYLRQLKEEKPAFIGVEFFHSFMGSLTRNYEDSVNGDFVDVTGRMNANALGLNLIGRYYPSLKMGPIEPFFEVHFGGKWLHSYLSESGFFSNEEEYDNYDFIKGDLVLAYGGAIGIQTYLDQNFYLSLKGSYQVTNSAEFYRRIEDEINVFPLFPIDGFEIINSVTNNFKIDIGFTYLY